MDFPRPSPHPGGTVAGAFIIKAFYHLRKSFRHAESGLYRFRSCHFAGAMISLWGKRLFPLAESPMHFPAFFIHNKDKGGGL